MKGIITILEFDFQKIRIVLNGYETVNLEQYTSQSMRYQVSIHNTAIITSIGATKENALKLLMKYYNITAENVISFGDDTSDIGILKASSIGVAIGNALQEVKEAADYITLTNNEDGVAEYFERYILAADFY